MKSRISCRAQVERLERRRLLSVEGVDGTDGDVPQAEPPVEDPSVGVVAWNGQEAFARRGEWITQFDGVAGPAGEQVTAIRQRLTDAGSPLDVAGHLGADGLVLLRAPGGTDTIPHSSLAGVQGVRFAEPNFVSASAASSPNDPLFDHLWGLHNVAQPEFDPAFGDDGAGAIRPGVVDADIDMPEAWDLTTGAQGFGHGRPVVIGVIDTGVDYTHPELADNMWRNVPELHGTPGVDDDGNGYVDDVYGYDFVGEGDPDPMDEAASSHGTHVSGMLGAVGNNGVGVAGVNHRVEIMALKFIPGGQPTTYADAIEAFNYATLMRTRGVNIRLTNNSWGGDVFSQALHDAVAASGEAGLLCVVAAHNQNRNIDVVPKFPASYDLPNIISVAMTTNSDARANISNFGPVSVDLGAPGRRILSTVRGPGYRYLTGTSMSAAYVSGVAALGWGLRPGATHEQIKDAILSGVDPIPSMNGITVTGGRLNAFNTLRLLLPGESATALAHATPGEPAAAAESAESATDDVLDGAGAEDEQTLF